MRKLRLKIEGEDRLSKPLTKTERQWLVKHSFACAMQYKLSGGSSAQHAYDPFVLVLCKRCNDYHLYPVGDCDDALVRHRFRNTLGTVRLMCYIHYNREKSCTSFLTFSSETGRLMDMEVRPQDDGTVQWKVLEEAVVDNLKDGS